MAEWTVDAKGIEAVFVSGAVAEHTVGEEGSRIVVTVPNRRADWSEKSARGLFILRPKDGPSSSGNVTNVISGGTHHGMVIQAGNIRGDLHIGPNGVSGLSGLSDGMPLKVTLVVPPGVEVDYES